MRGIPQQSFFFGLLFLLSVTQPMCFPAYGKESEQIKLSAEGIAAFADSLFDEEDYYRAISEYKRLIFHFPDSPLSKSARLKIPLSYFKGKKFEAAISGFSEILDLYPEEDIYWEALLYLGKTHYQIGDYEKAIRFFSDTETRAPDPSLKKKARIGRGWALVKMGMWDDASGLFKAAAADYDSTDMDKLSLEAISGNNLPKKSPSLAGALSAVVPGAGQLYIGRKKDALAAFLLNGAFIWGTVEAFENDEHAVGGILLFFEAGWYAGNIYSAVSGAHKFNRQVKDNFIRHLERSYSIGMNEKGDLLGFVNIRY